MIQICICQVLFDTFMYNFIMVNGFRNNKIADLRKNEGLSQRQLAKIVNTSQANLSRWEQGLNEPSIMECWKLADYFGVSIDFLCGRQEY